MLLKLEHARQQYPICYVNIGTSATQDFGKDICGLLLARHVKNLEVPKMNLFLNKVAVNSMCLALS